MGNIQVREKRRMRISLRSWRGVLWNRRAEISETGRRDDPKAFIDKFSRVGETLIEAAAGAMDRY
jgi:hypothetical protein